LQQTRDCKRIYRRYMQVIHTIESSQSEFSASASKTHGANSSVFVNPSGTSGLK
jgi:hypothetical protein